MVFIRFEKLEVGPVRLPDTLQSPCKRAGRREKALQAPMGMGKMEAGRSTIKSLQDALRPQLQLGQQAPAGPRSPRFAGG